MKTLGFTNNFVDFSIVYNTMGDMIIFVKLEDYGLNYIVYTLLCLIKQIEGSK